MTEREFADQIQQVKVPGGTVAREKLLARLGGALLVLGPVVALVAYSLSHSTENALQQRDAIVVGAVAVTLSVAGLALFLRYSLGALLRLWLARLVAERENP